MSAAKFCSAAFYTVGTVVANHFNGIQNAFKTRSSSQIRGCCNSRCLCASRSLFKDMSTILHPTTTKIPNMDGHSCLTINGGLVNGLSINRPNYWLRKRSPLQFSHACNFHNLFLSVSAQVLHQRQLSCSPPAVGTIGNSH